MGVIIYYKDIKGYEGRYKIDENGFILRVDYVTPTYRKTFKTNYEYIDLYKNGQRKRFSIHRLVAEHFIPNPNNLPEVDHIDNDPFHNHVSNLQWISSKDNLLKSYATLGPVRNFIECALYKDNELIKTFHSITECCKYGQELGLSFSMLQKYRQHKGYIIKV